MAKTKDENKPKMEEDTEKKSGRLGRLDEETLGYYRRVSDTMKDGFEEQEDKELLLNNVFTQLCEEAVKVSRNQTVSTIVETLLKEATEEQLMKFLLAFSSDWETVCTDRFAGYVTQTLLHQIKPYLRSSKGEESAKALFLQLYGFLMGNLAVFMQDTYASHVLRVVIEVLGGVEVSENVIRSKAARSRHAQATDKQKPKPYKQPSDFKEYLKSMSKKLFTMKRLKDHAENHLSNPVLQTALLVLSKSDPDVCTEMCQQLISNTEMFSPGPNNGLPSLLTHDVGSHLVEQLMVAAPEPLFDSILKVHIAPHLFTMALDPVANFVLQRAISQAHTEEQFKKFYKSLSPNIEDFLAHNHMGIVTKLAEGCVKHGTKQQKFIQDLMKAFHCYEPEERQMKFVTLLASLVTYDKFYKIKESDSSDEESDDEEEVVLPQLKVVNIHGSLLLQKLLNFGNPRPLVTSFMDMKQAELKTMACDKSGSHIIDAYLNSQTVGEKNREKLFNKLKGTYLDLSCDRGGSRVVDALWAVASLKQKQAIATELAKQENKLRNDRFGRFVWRNLSIGHFIRRPNDWKEVQSGNIKKRQLFEEIIKDKPESGSAVKGKLKSDSADEEDAGNLKLLDSDEEEASNETLNEIDAIFSKKRKSEATQPENDSSSKKQKKSKKRKSEVEIEEEPIEVTEAVPKKKKKKKKKVLDNN